ncbi:MAG: hypothetical protein GX653_09410 [Clostridiales bacterium]|nr:hypothetical protein [Clostridiales bacterium]
MNSHENKSDAQSISEILESVGDKIPKLITGVMNSFYTKEAGTSMGQAVGAYYRELVDAGIPQGAALEMTKEFSFSLKKVMNQSGGFHTDGRDDDQPQGFSFNFTPNKKKQAPPAEDGMPRDEG